MLLLLCLVFAAAAALLLALPVVLWRREIYRRYSGGRLVECPENQQACAVNIDLKRAVATGIDGTPQVRVCDCTRWPERTACSQGCLPQAVQPEPEESSAARPGTKQIYHLPVALAAFAAWCLGALWHSQYTFRTQWMEAVGLTRDEVKQMVWWLSPHLLTAGLCLLFAYGVAWLLAVSHRKGVLQGVLMAALLCGAVVAAASFGLGWLPRELLAVEAGYMVLATVMIGAIVGGLNNRLVLAAD